MNVYRHKETRVSHFLPALDKDALYLGVYCKPKVVSQIVLYRYSDILRNFPFSEKVFQLALRGKLTWWQTLKHQYIRMMGY